MPTHLLRHRQFQVCAALLAADCLVFTLINPSSANAVWLIIGYSLLSLTIISLASLLAQLFKVYGDTSHRLGKRFLRYGAVVMVFLIGLQSIGQLTTKDVLTLLPFAVIAYAYFGYGQKKLPERAAVT